MTLRVWGLLWAVAGLLCWAGANSPGDFSHAFVTALWLFGVLASLSSGRCSLALVAAPLLCALLLAARAGTEHAWPLAVLLGLQLIGGTSLASLLLCLLTYAAIVQNAPWIAVGSTLLLGHALLLGYLRSRGRLDPLLARAQQLSWLGIKTVAVLLLIAVAIGALTAGTGGGGLMLVFILRGMWAGLKSEEKKHG